jgi:Skp family chaperone for outer membrane proteins
MRHLTFASLVLAVLMTALTAQAPVQAGVVDMMRVLNEHPETKDRVSKVEADTKASLEKLKAEFAKAKQLEEELDLLKEGTPEHLEKLRQISQLKATFELDQKTLMMRSNLEIVDVMKDIYAKCVDKVGEVAKARGLNIVFMTTSAKIGGRTRAETMNEIAARPVVWSDASLDITSEVLRALGQAGK